MIQIREFGVRCPAIIDPLEFTDRAIDLMWEEDIRYLIVMDDARFVGLVSDGDLLESVGMLRRAERIALGSGLSQEEVLVADIMDVDCPVLSPSDVITDAAQRMVLEKRQVLPVIDQGQPLGILTEGDLLTLLAGTCWLQGEDMTREPVMQFGSHVLKMIGPDDSLATACSRLSARIRHLLVVEKGRLLGMLSDWDIRLAVGEHQSGEWMNRPVRDYMSTGVQTLRPRDTLGCAAEVMRLDGLSAVPITSREGELLGIVTITDLLRAIAGAAPISA